MKEGSIQRKSLLYTHSGVIKNYAMTLLEFADFLLDDVPNNVAIMSGVHSSVGACMTCLSKQKKARPQHYGLNAITRTKEYINHDNNKGSGLVILDIDMPNDGDRAIVKPDDFYRLLCELFPNFSKVNCFSIGSSSSTIKGLNKANYRLYFVCDTPTLIPDLMSNIHAHLWLHPDGYGWHELSKNGTYLNRSIIDLAMRRPNQLDICSSPIIGKGIEQTKRWFKWHHKDESFDETTIFKGSEIKGLTIKERNSYQRLLSKSKLSLKSASQALSGTCKEQALQSHIDDGGTITSFNKSYQSVVVKGDVIYLPSTHKLYFDSNEVTVETLLENRQKYNEVSLFDPLDGVNDEGNEKAIFYSNEDNDQHPCIHSFGHAESLFLLQHPVRDAIIIEGEVELDEGCSQLKEAMESVFNSVENKSNTVISATVGLGKTRAVFDAADTIKLLRQGRFVHLYVPTHNLANDIKTNMAALYPALNIAIQKGRDKDNCQRYDEIRGSGVKSIRRSFCDDGNENKCLYFDDCVYIKQWDNLTALDVLILPHTYLKYKQYREERKPDLVIIDERFSATLTHHKQYTGADLKGIIDNIGISCLEDFIINFKNTRVYMKDNTHLAEKLEAFVSDWNTIRLDNEMSPSGYAGDTHHKKHDLILTLKTRYGFNASSMHMSALEEFTVDKYEYAVNLIAVIRGEYRGIVTTKAETIFFHYQHFKEVSDLYAGRFSYFKGIVEGSEYDKTPILYMDGNVDTDITKVLLGNDVKFVPINVKRNMSITQCHTQMFGKQAILSGSKSSTQLRESLVELINITATSNHFAYNRRTLLVTYLALEESKAFTNALSPHISVAHFGGIRGLDYYKGYNIIILGRNQIPSNEIILDYIDLFGQKTRRGKVHPDPEVAKYADWSITLDNDIVGLHQFESFESYYATDDDRYEEIKGKENYFTNDQLNQLLHQTREVESMQAIARCRDIRAEDKQMTQVLLLSSLPLDLKVGRILPWSALNPLTVRTKHYDKLNRLLLDFFESHNGIVLQAAQLLKQHGFIENATQWKKVFAKEEVDKRYVQPMGRYDAGRLKHSDEDHAYRYPKTITYELIDCLGIPLVAMMIKFKSANRRLKLIYDPVAHTERSALHWAYKHFGEINGYVANGLDSHDERQMIP